MEGVPPEALDRSVHVLCSGAQRERTRLPEILAQDQATPRATSTSKTQAARRDSHRISAFISDGLPSKTCTPLFHPLVNSLKNVQSGNSSATGSRAPWILQPFVGSHPRRDEGSQQCVFSKTSRPSLMKIKAQEPHTRRSGKPCSPTPSPLQPRPCWQQQWKVSLF